MATFSGTLKVGLSGSYIKASDLTTLTEIIDYTNSPTAYTNGTGANQINAFYADTRTLAATNESFDLDAGTITDSYGTGLVFTKIKLLYIRNKSTTTAQTLTLTGDFLTQAGFGAAAGGLIIGPGGLLCLDNPIDGYSITAGTGDVITVTNAASFDYDIIIGGTV